MQLGCEARVTASCDGDGIWKIFVVQLLHNHDLSPTKSRIYRCNRSLPASVKKQLEVNDKAGIPLHKSFQAAVVEAGGYEELGFIEKDCRNYIEEFRRLRLGLGNASTITPQLSGLMFMYVKRDSHEFKCMEVRRSILPFQRQTNQTCLRTYP
ncbi:unnamed protein product [Cuscuta campestris]|uniref:Protein FAR1-RELATED SEQUENCE n=1 Tax=Cuscuta campestris TaxID=132261 RepID=A0A484KUP3_9ASTE|nr:unnamed protein product [Cuscuta campestris]